MKFYVIEFENGAYRHGYFNNYSEAIDYADSLNVGCDYTISEYDSEEDYDNSL